MPRVLKKRLSSASDAAGKSAAAEHMPRETTVAATPASDIHEYHDGSHNALKSPNGETAENAITELKREEIVFVLQTSDEANAEYLIYSLSERSPTDDGDGKPFTLNVVRAQKQQLPENLSEFLLDRDNLPPSHLRPPHEMHIVVSTRSGLRLAPDFYKSVLRPLLEALGLEERGESQDGNGNGQGYRVTVTKDSNTVRDFAGELGRDGTAGQRTVILLSGDGGVVDLLNGLDKADPQSNGSRSGESPTPPTIALLPLGTGNALFHSLHKPLYTGADPVPTPLVLGLRTLLKGTPAPLPTFRASFSPGAKLVSAPTESEPGSESLEESPTSTPSIKDHANEEPPVDHLLGAIVASYGFHASLVWESDTPAYRVHGDKRFGMAAAELLKVSHAYDATVAVRRRGGELVTNLYHQDSDGNKREGQRFNYVLTTLVSNLEKTFTISPASRPLDDQLRLVHFGDVGGDKTMEIMMAAYRDGEHVGMAEVGYEEVEEVMATIAEEDPRWRKVCVDGSIVEVEKGGWMRVRREERERLRVLVDAAVAR